MSRTIRTKRKKIKSNNYVPLKSYTDKELLLIGKYIIAPNRHDISPGIDLSRESISVIWIVDNTTKENNEEGYFLRMIPKYGTEHESFGYTRRIDFSPHLNWFVTDSKRLIKRLVLKSKLNTYYI